MSRPRWTTQEAVDIAEGRTDACLNVKLGAHEVLLRKAPLCLPPGRMERLALADICWALQALLGEKGEQ